MARERAKEAFEELQNVLDSSEIQHLDLVIVFGSYARGYPREDSDLDMFVVTEEISSQWTEFDDPSRIGIEWADDLPEPHIIASQPLEFAQRYYDEEDGEFVKTVVEEGAYVRNVPKDVLSDVDYDPIAERKR